MLEKPDVADEQLAACLRNEYGLYIVEIAFLPLGADANTAVYRVIANDGTPYFLKLRSGVFDEMSVAIPRFLSDHGIAQIIAPIETSIGQLSTRLDAFAVILYPFVAGGDGYQGLSDAQCVELGRCLNKIHTTTLPHALAERIPRETYTTYWRDRLRQFQIYADETVSADPISAGLATFLKAQHAVISDLVERAEHLAATLQTRPLSYVLCHADIHAGNVLIDGDDKVYIVDWDTLILAPKERDLMFVGAGLSFCDTPEQSALFYQGYGPTEIDPLALAYYRYERIVQDIAAFCEEIFLAIGGGADRQQALNYLVTQFRPNNVVETALRSQVKPLVF
jgi:spectinomycin phosphotransferase